MVWTRLRPVRSLQQPRRSSRIPPLWSSRRGDPSEFKDHDVRMNDLFFIQIRKYEIQEYYPTSTQLHLPSVPQEQAMVWASAWWSWTWCLVTSVKTVIATDKDNDEHWLDRLHPHRRRCIRRPAPHIQVWEKGRRGVGTVIKKEE